MTDWRTAGRMPLEGSRKSGTQRLIHLVVVAGAGLLLVPCSAGGGSRPNESCAIVDRQARIRPDYSGVVLPPNIAPLNFAIEEPGVAYFVRLHATNGKPIEVLSETGEIHLPLRSWRQLLENNRGRTLNLDIFVKSEPRADAEKSSGPWRRFALLTNTIAKENVDDFIVYRRIRPGHSLWRHMGVYQRDLRTYEETVILTNDYYRQGCVNCHTFCSHRADKMLLGIRSNRYGSSEILVEGQHVTKIGTKFGYTSWHPSGTVAAYSINRVRQLLHSGANEIRDVLDYDSLIAYYRVDEKAVSTAPALARKDWLETYPTWSPDGGYLYFCCAPITWEDRYTIPKDFDQIRYSLVRIRYDLDRDQWGELESVLSADQTGKSILLPRISPDGRWLLLSMCDYGCFPVYRQSSDLYLMDLEAAGQTGRYECRRLEINSDASESWHSWSSNGRWIAFSSKRLSHNFTRTYLAYVDDRGTVHKPFLLPQKDPHYYDSCLWTFSVPELVMNRVPVRKETIGRVVRGGQQIGIEMPITMATPSQEAAVTHDEPWRQSGIR